ncbi:hypothetical protein PMIN06_004368 [Paraphaeosphaeria minitans]|uniref:Uncharacterized protein n=1 Tax=Paraphaeosphaeria minitans TaxID=565426 RepID=A0A9P6GJP0_9PLEO|nr:hypothetical protein PMIN01_04660 [Paraphaeosphaeria minitans]
MQQDLDERNPGGHPELEVFTWLQILNLAVSEASNEGRKRKKCFDAIQKTCLKKQMTKEDTEDVIGPEGMNMVKGIVSAFKGVGGQMGVDAAMPELPARDPDASSIREGGFQPDRASPTANGSVAAG